MRRMILRFLTIVLIIASFSIVRGNFVTAQNSSRPIGAIVRAYTDLKRHVICDSTDAFFCNERLIQSGVPVEQFLTRKLWDVGNTAPYGHRGDLTTITEAILHHAGEARLARERFAALSGNEQAEIVEFLKQLQILPNGSPRRITEHDLRELLKIQKSVTASSLQKENDQP